jgi:hypothetical protein
LRSNFEQQRAAMLARRVRHEVPNNLSGRAN